MSGSVAGFLVVKVDGAGAVYLYYEESSDATTHISSFYARIKVLTEKGKELATVSMPYERGVDKVKDKDIEGRTIHADGTVIPLSVKSSDLMEVKTKDFQMNSVVFNLPSVEVGSILEYRVKFHRSGDWEIQPTWLIQKPNFIHQAHYEFNPGYYSNLHYMSYVGSGAKVVDKKGIYTLDIADVPPEPNEDWMPPLNTLRWRVEFYYSQYASIHDFWINARKNWAIWVQEFTKPTNHLKEAVAGIVAPDDSEEVKARKIYAAVMKLENTAFTRQKSKAERKKDKLKDIHKAEDVWKQKSGSDDDIALLYVALARAAGLKV